MRLKVRCEARHIITSSVVSLVPDLAETASDGLRHHISMKCRRRHLNVQALLSIHYYVQAALSRRSSAVESIVFLAQFP
jgi:hypothetical protein